MYQRRLHCSAECLPNNDRSLYYIGLALSARFCGAPRGGMRIKRLQRLSDAIDDERQNDERLQHAPRIM
jgi:hypothetical protein